MKAKQNRLVPVRKWRRGSHRFFVTFAAVACSLALIVSLVIAAPDPIRVIVNGELLEGDVAAVVVDGVLMVPLAAIVDALGGEFEYDVENDMVRISLAADRFGTPAFNESSQEPPAPDDTVVFIAKSGTKYHRQDCRYVASGGEAITLSEARQRGYSPCKVCDPPQ